MSIDEPLVVRRKVVRGSERSFGVVFAVVFALIGLWPVLYGSAPRLWAIAVAAAFLAAALLRPGLLAVLNRIWFRVGLLLHRIVNPLLMFVIYCVSVVPIGFVLRMLGKDLLRLRLERGATSYWIVREPPGPIAGSMTKQF